jgi:excisionase family DNA binding protein
MTTQSRTVSKREVAEALGMSTRTVERQLRAGTFPLRRLRLAGHVKFNRADLERLLAGQSGWPVVGRRR